jgi:hypothetical protein
MILIDTNGNRKGITDEEYQLLIDAANAWSKEAHLAEINALHEAEFDRRWRQADYVGRWEVSAVANDESNPYNTEAKAIMAYWWSGWDVIKAYSETVTENNFIEPKIFVDGL